MREGIETLTMSFMTWEPILGHSRRKIPVCGETGPPGREDSPPQWRHRLNKHDRAMDRNETVGLLRHRKDKGQRMSPLKLSRLMMTLSETA